MTMNSGPALAFRTYENNHIYVYPEHRDHDAEEHYPAKRAHDLWLGSDDGLVLPFLAGHRRDPLLLRGTDRRPHQL